MSSIRVLMLGWEFPPFITGGLGTACYGLTRAMDRRGMDVTFVLPKHVDEDHADHIRLISPSTTGAGDFVEPAHPVSAAAPAETKKLTQTVRETLLRTAKENLEKAGHIRFVDVPAGFVHPYSSAPAGTPVGEWIGERSAAPAGSQGAWSISRTWELERAIRTAIPEAEGQWTAGFPMAEQNVDYGGDLIGQAERYARFCVAATRSLSFDVVHAHDWLTYPAGLAIAQVSGKPLVVHVHSTEFDRSGIHVNQRIYDVERRGMHGAIRIISVSMLTKNLCVNRYAVPADKIEVVYNGVDIDPVNVGIQAIESKDRIVLYFGRITMQKGPEYFIGAAKRVLEIMPDVKFVVAGSGDQAQRMIEMAANLGIGHKVLFTGFLRGKDITRVFALADLYVMPSVSEPFGIAPLEALGHNVPVLISKSSGVSEVLTHALKVDFWDVDDIANKIVAVLRYPPLSSTLRQHGHFEVRKLTWDGAAARCEKVYAAAVAAMGRKR
jgi:glycogen synthase